MRSERSGEKERSSKRKASQESSLRAATICVCTFDAVSRICEKAMGVFSMYLDDRVNEDRLNMFLEFLGVIVAALLVEYVQRIPLEMEI